MILLKMKSEEYVGPWSRQIKMILESIPEIKAVNIEDIDDHSLENQVVFNVGNHQYAGSILLSKTAKKLSRCKKLVAFIDDYTSPPASQLYNSVRGKDNAIITNMPDLLKIKTGRMFSWAVESFYVNLNALSWNPMSLTSPSINGLIYYGSFRKGREDYFEKYLGLEATEIYPVSVSSSRVALKKFIDLNFMIDGYPKPKDLLSFLQKFEFSVYIADDFSNDNYNSPANRFYECASAGLALFFDESSRRTFDIAGINIDDYVVSSPSQIKDRMNSGIQKEQRSMWAYNYKEDTIKDFQKAVEALL